MSHWNINTISKVEIQENLELNEVQAEKIIESRINQPFSDIADLVVRIEGINTVDANRLAGIIRFNNEKNANNEWRFSADSDVLMRSEALFATKMKGYTVTPIPYGSNFEKPVHDNLPLDHEDIWKRFWGRFDLNPKDPPGCTYKGSVGINLAGHPPPSPQPNCTLWAILKETYAVETAVRCDVEKTVTTIRSISMPGGGGGVTILGSGGSVTAPDFHYEVWVHKIGALFKYELQISFYKIIWNCPNGEYTQYWNSQIGWGLVETKDPVVCSSELKFTFDTLPNAKIFANSFGYPIGYPALGLISE